MCRHSGAEISTDRKLLDKFAKSAYQCSVKDIHLTFKTLETKMADSALAARSFLFGIFQYTRKPMRTCISFSFFVVKNVQCEQYLELKASEQYFHVVIFIRAFSESKDQAL